MLRGNEIDSPDVELLSAAGIGVLVVRPHAGGRAGVRPDILIGPEGRATNTDDLRRASPARRTSPRLIRPGRPRSEALSRSGLGRSHELAVASSTSSWATTPNLTFLVLETPQQEVEGRILVDLVLLHDHADGLPGRERLTEMVLLPGVA